MSDSKDEDRDSALASDGNESSDDSAFRDVLHQVARAEPRTPPIFLAHGTRLGPYTILDRLGRGGMGVVYRAVDSRLSREVALKVLRGSVAGDERRRRFLREARSAAAINHPNVAIVFEVGEADDHIFLAMELIEGETLRAKLAGGALGAVEGARIAREISMGLAPAHAKGIVHRDLKPENVMITPRGGVKVLDFGLAKLRAAAGATPDESLGHRETETRDGTVLGTPAYMAPEQAMGEPTDARTDVFALGVVLYELVTGTRPGLLGAGPQIEDERIADIVRGAIASAPADRFANAGEMLAAFDTLFSQPPASGRPSGARGQSLAPHRSETTPEAFTRAPPRRFSPPRRFWISVGTIFAVAVAAYTVLRPTFLRTQADEAGTTASASGSVRLVEPIPPYFERRLTAYSTDTLVQALAVSSDGLKYAFTVNDDLHVAAVGGSSRARVPLPAGEKGGPTEIQFFPDGKKLLVGGFPAKDEHTWILSLDGAPPQRGPDAMEFALSPDGARIAYRHLSGIYVSSVGGGKSTYIESIFRDERSEVAWSPDGERLAVARVVDAAALLEVARPDGSSHKTIASDIKFEIDLARPTWTANDRVAFQNVAADHTVAIMEIAVDASDGPLSAPRRLWTRPAAHLQNLEYRNHRFFFVRVESQRDVYVGRLDNQKHFEKPLSRYTTSDEDDRLVGWAPDGRLVYVTEAEGDSRVFVAKVASKEAGTPLNSPNTAAFGLSGDGAVMTFIHPPQSDGSTLARLGLDGDRRDLFPVRGLPVERGTISGCARCANKNASRCVLGESDGVETSFSMFNPLNGTREKAFARLRPLQPWRCSLSADGSVLYLPDEDGLRTVNVATGAVTMLGAHEGGAVQYVGTLPDSTDLLISGVEIGGHRYALGRMSADGARIETFWSSETLWVWGPEIAPNGRDIAVSARAIDTDVYMLSPADMK